MRLSIVRLAVRLTPKQQLIPVTRLTGARLYSTESALPQSTIDSDEVVKFRQFASQWWDPNGSLKPLHSMNRLRVPLIRDSLCPPHTHVATIATPTNGFAPLSGMSILDVGCGGGILSEVGSSVSAPGLVFLFDVLRQSQSFRNAVFAFWA
ncbi:unnamed protein product [Echinostoma caproni]|uniref:Ubiquinone biosynthesis O-methyltransferase, mitochondrial n=1 Tax=Echinostoma caproni TaxID=27848 RepID=A0A183BCB5_9TREM|nr:unnamed protein product [Echinostoma caproni]